MTSPARIEANRRNAQRSTGPKTAAGKARSAQNARKHGLWVSVWRDPQARPAIERLADAIAGAGASAARRDRASRIAAAQMTLLRAREARRRLLAQAVGTEGVVDRLARIERCEAEASSRRNSVIRELEGYLPETNPMRRRRRAYRLSSRNEPNKSDTKPIFPKRSQEV